MDWGSQNWPVKGSSLVHWLALENVKTANEEGINYGL